jgi:CheY-like chemotaxis protein
MLDKKKILVVDDELLIQNLFRYLLEPKYEVYSINNGREALDFLMTDVIIDLIITDLEMPILNGIELIEQLNTNESLRTKVPIIMISGNSEFDPNSLIQSNKIHSFMRKPIRGDLFKTEIATLLDKN